MSEEQQEIASMTKSLIDFSKLGKAITKMSKWIESIDNSSRQSIQDLDERVNENMQSVNDKITKIQDDWKQVDTIESDLLKVTTAVQGINKQLLDFDNRFKSLEEKYYHMAVTFEGRLGAHEKSTSETIDQLQEALENVSENHMEHENRIQQLEDELDVPTPKSKPKSTSSSLDIRKKTITKPVSSDSSQSNKIRAATSVVQGPKRATERRSQSVDAEPFEDHELAQQVQLKSHLNPINEISDILAQSPSKPADPASQMPEPKFQIEINSDYINLSSRMRQIEDEIEIIRLDVATQSEKINEPQKVEVIQPPPEYDEFTEKTKRQLLSLEQRLNMIEASTSAQIEHNSETCNHNHMHLQEELDQIATQTQIVPVKDEISVSDFQIVQTTVRAIQQTLPNKLFRSDMEQAMDDMKNLISTQQSPAKDYTVGDDANSIIHELRVGGIKSNERIRQLELDLQQQGENLREMIADGNNGLHQKVEIAITALKRSQQEQAEKLDHSVVLLDKATDAYIEHDKKITDAMKKLKLLDKMLNKTNQSITKLNEVVFQEMDEAPLPLLAGQDSQAQVTTLQNQFIRYENQFKLVHARQKTISEIVNQLQSHMRKQSKLKELKQANSIAEDLLENKEGNQTIIQTDLTPVYDALDQKVDKSDLVKKVDRDALNKAHRALQKKIRALEAEIKKPPEILKERADPIFFSLNHSASWIACGTELKEVKVGPQERSSWDRMPHGRDARKISTYGSGFSKLIRQFKSLSGDLSGERNSIVSEAPNTYRASNISPMPEPTPRKIVDTKLPHLGSSSKLGSSTRVNFK